jgi:transposase
MNPLAQLGRLNLDSAAKSQVVALFQTLLDQAARDAKTIQAKDLKIQALTHELAHIRRLRYGVKSEALSPLQRDVFEEDFNTDLAAIEAVIEQFQGEEAGGTTAKPKRPCAGRQPLPGHLPRIGHRHEPESCTCGQCGSELVKIGEDITEQLDVEPAKFFVHRHIRPQYACRSCVTITAAPVPPAVIDGGMAAVGLLAWVIISKYLDHLPL